MTERPSIALPYASLDGTLGPADEATIPVTDDGLLRGDGAFEVTRLYRGVPFALDEHLERLARTCVGLRLPADERLLRQEIAALTAAVGPVDAVLRVVLTRAGRRLVMVEPLPAHPPAASVATITFAPSRVLDGLKTLSYAGNMLAARLAREAGADEALLVTPHGRVLEGATWTFFWVDAAGTLRTPPLSDRILRSITRDHIIAETGALEEVLVLERLLQEAEEAFIASSVREVLPISEIDGRPLPAAPGPVTAETALRLRARIARAVAGADVVGVGDGRGMTPT